MGAQIIGFEHYRERRAHCLHCQHGWFMAEPEGEFASAEDLLPCPRCRQQQGIYTHGWVECSEEEYSPEIHLIEWCVTSDKK